jgi:hypothetical protein
MRGENDQIHIETNHQVKISFSRHSLVYEDDNHSSIKEEYIFDSSNYKRI